MKIIIECILTVIILTIFLYLFGIIQDMNSIVDRDQYRQLKFS